MDRDRNEVIAAEIGDASGASARRLWSKVAHHKVKYVATDGNYSYERILPRNIIHLVTKAKTALVEAKNSSLRDILAKLNRKTKRYSK